MTETIEWPSRRPSLLYRWKAELVRQGGPAASALDERVRLLEKQLRRAERERDILTKQEERH